MPTGKKKIRGSFVSRGEAHEVASRQLSRLIDALNHGDEGMTREQHSLLLHKVRSWIAAGSRARMEKVCKVLLRLSPGSIEVIPDPVRRRDGTWDVASNYFMSFLFIPFRERIGEPCLNCGLWYFKNTAHESLFCSRACAAKRKLARRRHAARQRKLERAQAAIVHFESRPKRWRELALKEWVTQAEPDISPNFLTIAFKSGELNLPSERPGN